MEAREFDCCECGIHIIQMIPDDSVLCVTCIFMPGWYRDPKLRDIMDPEGWVDPSRYEETPDAHPIPP
jgi:hypothetical protein